MRSGSFREARPTSPPPSDDDPCFLNHHQLLSDLKHLSLLYPSCFVINNFKLRFFYIFIYYLIFKSILSLYIILWIDNILLSLLVLLKNKYLLCLCMFQVLTVCAKCHRKAQTIPVCFEVHCWNDFNLTFGNIIC